MSKKLVILPNAGDARTKNLSLAGSGLPFKHLWCSWRDPSEQFSFGEQFPSLLTALWAVRFAPDKPYTKWQGDDETQLFRTNFIKVDPVTVANALRYGNDGYVYLVPFAMRGTGPDLDQGIFKDHVWKYTGTPAQYAERYMVEFGSPLHQSWIRKVVWSRFMGDEHAAVALKATGDTPLEYQDISERELGISGPVLSEVVMTIRAYLQRYS
ncbi:MAG: hypothetical protein RJB39_172 [Candidatus Parcubacteria bacterium]|jgi:hypothetical protein